VACRMMAEQTEVTYAYHLRGWSIASCCLCAQFSPV
jgi:hypothetical protein